MKKRIILFILALFITEKSFAFDFEDLIGYTIVAKDSIKKVTDRQFGKSISLYDGWVFKVDLMYLSPFILTDVIIFAKPMDGEIVKKYQGKLPKHYFYSYKLLIDDEFYDAAAQ